MGIFKAYDIRGIYPDELDRDIARKIGYAFVKFFSTDKIAIGRDMRIAGKAVFSSLIEAITKAGVDVIDIGEVSTPMLTFAVGYYKYDAGVMITASHNPKEYIGFKVCKKDAYPIGYDNGLNEIEKMLSREISQEHQASGTVMAKDVMSDYVSHVVGQIDTSRLKDLKIVVDAGNGMGGVVCSSVFKGLPFRITPLYFEPDGTFPNHEPNPLKAENMDELSKAVRRENADVGIAFDGDADRVMFVDEKGDIISSDMITILIGKMLLAERPGSRIIYDVRSSRAVREELEKDGAQTSMCRVGHVFIKRQLRHEQGIFAGELSGHYYFKENYYSDDGMLPALYVFLALSESGLKMSELIRPFRRYFTSGEINWELDNADEKIRDLENIFRDGKACYLDGLTISYDTWWFNVRKSNTEPMLRLNLEADDPVIGKAKLDHVLSVIRGQHRAGKA